MINPSASGWINKFLLWIPPAYTTSQEDFYLKTRNTGFLYGYIISLGIDKDFKSSAWTNEEISKVALLNTLYNTYNLISTNGNATEFIEKAIGFYNEMSPKEFSIIKKVLASPKPSIELEKIIDERVQTNNNIISKNFSHILTNALLFMDVLAFRQYLLYNEIPNKYLKRFEETVVSVVSLALKTKSSKTLYDNLLIKLFESSVRFTKFSKINPENLEKLQLDYFESILEKNYILDIAVMAVWSDKEIEESEINFLSNITDYLNIEKDVMYESLTSFDIFIQKYQKEIPYFKYSNPVRHFYNQASQNVILLITRNKNRLLKELSNNAELMSLLTKSTHTTLGEKEKKKIKKQLLEICKTIPSLTIFLLPGGSLLLPLLVKFIPQLLPSVFNENLDNDE